MANQKKDIIVEIDMLLARIESDPAHREAVSKVRTLLASLTPTSPPARRRTGAETVYRVEGGGEQATLAETRPTGQPLRVAKRAYSALVDVLASAPRPLPFDEIMKELGQQSEDAPAEWQLRVLLRFLHRADPPIIRRTRSRYQAMIPSKTAKAAEKWWRATAR